MAHLAHSFVRIQGNKAMIMIVCDIEAIKDLGIEEGDMMYPIIISSTVFNNFNPTLSLLADNPINPDKLLDEGENYFKGCGSDSIFTSPIWVTKNLGKSIQEELSA